jgi:hypothetical protein
MSMNRYAIRDSNLNPATLMMEVLIHADRSKGNIN